MNEILENNEVMENEVVDVHYEETEEPVTFPTETIEEESSGNPIWLFVKLAGFGALAFVFVRKLWKNTVKPWFEALSAKRKSKREEEVYEMVKSAALRLGLLEESPDSKPAEEMIPEETETEKED